MTVVGQISFECSHWLCNSDCKGETCCLGTSSFCAQFGQNIWNVSNLGILLLICYTSNSASGIETQESDINTLRNILRQCVCLLHLPHFLPNCISCKAVYTYDLPLFCLLINLWYVICSLASKKKKTTKPFIQPTRCPYHTNYWSWAV